MPITQPIRTINKFLTLKRAKRKKLKTSNNKPIKNVVKNPQPDASIVPIPLVVIRNTHENTTVNTANATT